MKISDIITQLRSLRDNSADMAKGDPECDTWREDVDALNATIKLLSTLDPEAPEPPAPTRATILADAEACVCRDRESSYGSPSRNFKVAANMLADYISGKREPLDIEPKDVAAMMCIIKLARISTGSIKADNWIDLAGYAAIGGELEGRRGDD